MGFLARHRLETSTVTDAIWFGALEQVVPLAMIQAVAADADVPTERRRQLPVDVTLLLCVVMRLFTGFEMLERTLARGAHVLVRVPASRVPPGRVRWAPARALAPARWIELGLPLPGPPSTPPTQSAANAAIIGSCA